MATVGVRMPLIVPPDVAAMLDAQSRIHSWWHNHLVERVKDMRTRRDDPAIRALLYGDRELRNLLTGAKVSHPFLGNCWTYSLQCVAIRMTRTINLTRPEVRKRRGMPPLDTSKNPWAGWPDYTRWSTSWASLEYHALTGGFTLAGRALTLSFGKGDDGKQQRASLTLSQRVPPFARPATFTPKEKHDHAIRGLRITKEHGVYYAVFTTRRDLVAEKPLPATPRIVSLDPHYYSLAMCVDTDGVAVRIPYPPGARALGRRIDQLTARRDRCVRERLVDEQGVVRYHESARYRQFDHLIEQTERRRAERTTHYLYGVANWLYRHYDVVAIGDYSPTGPAHAVAALNRWMRNESQVGRLRQVCAWMAIRSGKRFMTWPEEGTTRTCADCGYVWPDGIPTRLRYYICPGCGLRQPRNVNNARQGLRRALTALELPNPAAVTVRVRTVYQCAGLQKPRALAP